MTICYAVESDIVQNVFTVAPKSRLAFSDSSLGTSRTSEVNVLDLPCLWILAFVSRFRRPARGVQAALGWMHEFCLSSRTDNVDGQAKFAPFVLF
eukprot:6906751-Pyramimonas_sp.AAC.1